ncbi:hypothetical protein FTUN_7550 [Frigoriglobus tundricola]|uniref:Uncharacterized protein n=1 Tax=Frigoriglobus tundricola TaxID=2774151 RepID=A0A6M5Z0L3_9BACT|nr:hypothetical protein FTUN_7550 [Frigoriglobus tundricola]
MYCIGPCRLMSGETSRQLCACTLGARGPVAAHEGSSGV